MSLDVADADRDGGLDVLVGEHNLASPASARLLIFENLDGRGSSWASHVIHTGDEHHDGAQFVDIEGDGDLDVISIGSGHSNVLLYENRAVGSSSEPDMVPPSITSVGASAGSTFATISWTTDEPATSQVDYGPDTRHGTTTARDPALVTSHRVTLSGLTPSATYYYRVRSSDSAGNEAVSSDFTFTTPEAVASGVQQTYLAFDGLNDRVQLPAFDLTGSATTIEFWFKADTLTNCGSSDCRFISKATGVNDSDHYWMVSSIGVGGVQRLRFRLRTNDRTHTLIAGSGNLSPEVGTHVSDNLVTGMSFAHGRMKSNRILSEHTFLRVYTLDPIQDPRWDAFVETHPAASVFHVRAWVQALQRSYAYQPVVYTTSPPGAPLTNGVLLCAVRSWLTGRRLVSVPFADHCEPLVALPEDRAAILDALLAASREWNYVELRPRTSGLWDGPSLNQSASFMFHALDLQPALEDLLGRAHHSTIQRKIHRAEREGVSYDEGRSEALLEAFFRLMLQTRRRHGLAPQPLQWFKNLIACFGSRLKIRVATKGGRPIGSILTLQHGDTLVYKYGGSDARFHSLGAMPFLFWKCIQDAKASGVQTFDLGRSDVGNAGLITFKERLGATPSTLTYLRVPARERRASGWSLRLPARIAARMPDSVLAAAGKLLYRHIG